jgi:probable HAF family extracellular repeat protein
MLRSPSGLLLSLVIAPSRWAAARRRMSATTSGVDIRALLNRSGCLLAIAIASAVPADAMSFTPLGFLPGDSRSGAEAISSDGTTVVGWSQGNPNPSDAFRWTQSTGMVELVSATGGIGYSVSADGSVIAGGVGNSGAVLWAAPSYSRIVLGGGGYAYGTSADGSVTVGRDLDAAQWVGGTHTESFLGAGAGSMAHAVSDDGAVIVGAGLQSSHGTQPQPFRWTQATGAVGLGDLPGSGPVDGSALGISGDGNTIVGSNGNRAFAWTAAAGMYALSPYAPGAAQDASGDGSVIVGDRYNATISDSRAVLWNVGAPGFEFDLNDVAATVLPAGWVLKEALGVSADGLSIVGRGVNGSGQDEAFLLRLDTAPIPEPSTAVLLLAGLVGLAARPRFARIPERIAWSRAATRAR